MATASYTSVIRVREDLREGNYWVVTSEDLPELLLSGKNIEALRKDVPTVIKMLFKLNCDMDIEVRPAVKPREMTSKRPIKSHVFNRMMDWTAIPLEAT